MSVLSAMTMGYQALQSAGFIEPLHRSCGKLSNILHPNIMPSAADAVMAWRAGRLSQPAMVHACFAQGIFPPQGTYDEREAARIYPHLMGSAVGEKRMWDAVHSLNAGKPTIGDVVTLWQRGIIEQGEYHRLMNELGYWNEDWRSYIELAANSQMPSPGELVTFALREAWDQRTVDRYQYDAEFPPEFRAFMRQLGFDGRANPTPGRVLQAQPPTWSQIYWRAHWRALSPTQAFEMFQRLRPGRIERFGADFGNVRPFTIDDLRNVLKINDYPIPFRDQLGAVAYRKPRLVDIDRFYTNDSIDKKEVYELHLDLGYSPADAQMRTDWLERKKLQNPNNPAAKRLPAQIVRLWRLGRIHEDDARNRLMWVLSGGAYERYGIVGVPEAQKLEVKRYMRDVNLLIDEATATREIERSQKLLKAFKRQYVHGQLNANDLQASMARAGFTHAFISETLAEWDAELASGRLMLSTERIRRLTVQGIMPLQAAKEYLMNLGWQDPEISYILVQLVRDMDIEAEEQEERLARNEDRREAARLRQASLHARKRNQAITRLNKQATPAQLRKYYVRGIIDEREYERELQRRGYNDEAVKRMLRDGGIDRARYFANRRNRAAAVNAGSTPSGTPGQRQETQVPTNGTAPVAP